MRYYLLNFVWKMMKTVIIYYFSQKYEGHRKSACLNRFYALCDSVMEFLEGKNNDLRQNLINSKNDIAYMTDLFAKCNKTNLKLQGDQLKLIKTQSVISAFVVNCFLYKQNLGRGDCSRFKRFWNCKIEMKICFPTVNT